MYEGGPEDQWRYRAVRRETPFVFAFAGGLVMLFAITVGALVEDVPFWAHVAEFIIGVLLLITGAVLWYLPVRARVMIWSFAVAATVGALLLVGEGVAFDSQVPAGFALLLMTSTMPLLLDRRAAFTASAMMLAGVSVLAVVQGGRGGFDLLLLATSALLVSAALLSVRLRGFRDITDLQNRLLETATTDPYTGLLTPRGLLTLVPGMAANASRANRPICLVRVRITSLTADEQRYGRIYTHAQTVAVANAIRNNTRAGDLIAQWAEHEILIVAPSHAPDPTSLRRRFQDAIAASDITLGRPPVELDVSAVEGNPDTDTFEGLLHPSPAEASRPLTQPG
jgi:GGDEF domain-containing protein